MRKWPVNDKSVSMARDNLQTRGLLDEQPLRWKYFVPGSRFELPRLFKRHPLKMVRLPISPPGFTAAKIYLFNKVQIHFFAFRQTGNWHALTTRKKSIKQRKPTSSIV